MTATDGGGGKEPGPLRYAGLGIQLAVSLVVLVLAGRWADQKLGTGSLFTIAAPLVGFAGTMYSLVRQLNRKDGGGA